MERMVKDRLEWFVEKQNIIPPFISGFRKGRSSTDNIVFLENAIQKRINNKGHTIAIFLDLEKAYDTLNVEGLLTKIQKRGVEGNMLRFLCYYLTDRTYQVRINNKCSETKSLKRGLPQGSILSPLLFNIMMSDIPVDTQVGILLYADDIVIWMSGTSVQYMANKIQAYLNQLSFWFKKWGFKVSLLKTNGVLFTKSVKLQPPVIMLNEVALTFNANHRFLGVIFDSKLLWHDHIENIVKRCKSKLNILRCLSGTKWGSSSKTLLLVYRSYIRSLLDYGCEAYDGTSDGLQKTIDSIQYQALRICIGALPLTPLDALQVETGELPLDLRRQMLSLKFKYAISRIVDHPLIPHIQACWQFEYLKGKKGNKPFGYRTFEENTMEIVPISHNITPPWTLVSPNVCMELNEIVKKTDNPQYLLYCSNELIQRKWSTELHIYTDGSFVFEQHNASAAFWVPSLLYKQYKRLSYSISSYKAEMMAIILALTWLDQLDTIYVGVVIFSDSMSSLLSIKNAKDDIFVQEVILLLTHLKYKHIRVALNGFPLTVVLAVMKKLIITLKLD